MSTTTQQRSTTIPEIITIPGSAPMLIDPTSAKRRPALTEDEARELTTEIQRTSIRLWLLVTEAHDRAAHFALGYETWDDYVRAEFKMSPSRSYQLIDTGHVMRELAVAGADIDHMAPPPTRVISRIKDRLPAVRKATRAAVKKGEDPNRALRALAAEPRLTAPVSPRGEAESETPPAPPPRGRPPILVTCPACEGEGKVTRSMANRLRAFVRNITEQE